MTSTSREQVKGWSSPKENVKEWSSTIVLNANNFTRARQEVEHHHRGAAEPSWGSTIVEQQPKLHTLHKLHKRFPT
jgi:hypothetical protein